ncbi:M23 family metallopeptidase [Nocardioides currus]|uniref:M23 family metallopeptidase n=1 Tax=Nocardioides currus TaxID=2133958 RepID=UPI001403C104|nr:M23 family metallopeptidase [Nocardioides currus]
MKTPARRRLSLVSAAALAGLSLTLVTGSVAYAVPLTPYEMPFPCGQKWTGSTRGSHTPSMKAIDWNRPGDEGDTVVAAAAGMVTTADSTSTRSYGHHVVIDHGNGESTVYGHMDAVTVTAGQRVDQGTAIGTVGNTGNSHGAHLHFEERLGGTDVATSFNGVPYFFGDLTSFNCVDVPVAADFTGDAISEVAVFRRGKKSSFVVNEPAGARVMVFGNATDEPVLGDWDGDGTVNVGVWRAKKAKFRLKTATKVVKVGFGVPTDRAIAGDWDGNGTDEIGVYRSSVGTFYQRLADGSSTAVVLGDADDQPVTGDWDGNGVTDLGLYDPATSTFTLRVVDAGGQAWTSQLVLGVPGDLAVAGDWDGDGITDVGAWTPATATFTQGRAVFPMTSRIASSLPDNIAARTTVTTVRFGNPRG